VHREPKSAENPLFIDVGFTGKLPDGERKREVACRIAIPGKYEAADCANLDLECK
jgi:hypothetical protein